MKRALARRGLARGGEASLASVGSFCMEMVEALQRQGKRLAGGIAPVDGGRTGRFDCTDARQFHAHALLDLRERFAGLARRGEAQFVIVAAGERALTASGVGESKHG